MNEAELQALIDRRVKEEVREVLLSMGLDTSTPESVRKWQKKMAFLEGIEDTSRTLWGHFRLVVVGALALGLTYLVWEKVQGK